MSGVTKVDEILDFAIAREQEAVEFYTQLAGQAKNAAIREMFEQFAGEERGHKAKLTQVKQGKKLLSAKGEVLDLKLGEYLVTEEPGPDLDYAGALILAMKKEKAAFRLYTTLAGQAQDPAVKALLLGLAQEEAKHKLRFEVEYDDQILKEN
jgi:rubrerythrin